MGLLDDIRNKLNSESGASIIYAMMMFVVATLVTVLILSSALTSLKRSQKTVEAKQASLMLDSITDVLLEYTDPTTTVNSDKSKSEAGGMSYVMTDRSLLTCMETSESGRSPVKTDWEEQEKSYARTFTVSHSNPYLTSGKLMTASVSCEDKSLAALYDATMTYTAPETSRDDGGSVSFMPQMLEQGIMRGILYTERTSVAYKSEEHKENDGIIYARLPYDTSAGKNTALNKSYGYKITYVIQPALSNTQTYKTDGKNNITDYEIVFTIELEKTPENTDSKQFEDMGYKTYIVIPVSSIKAAQESSSVMEKSKTTNATGQTVRTLEKTVTKTTTITWQKGKVCDSNPLAD